MVARLLRASSLFSDSLDPPPLRASSHHSLQRSLTFETSSLITASLSLSHQPSIMSYWHHDNNDRAERTQGKRMLSQYTAGRTALMQSANKPTFFHNAQDVELFYPNLSNTAAGPPVRRTKAGGANVLRSAAINDTLSQLSAQNREHAQTQQLAAWHSQHEVKNKQGERSRNEKQSVARMHARTNAGTRRVNERHGNRGTTRVSNGSTHL